MKNAHQIHRDAPHARCLRRCARRRAAASRSCRRRPKFARNRDSLYPYRHDSYFYYLSGFPEPEAVVALVAGDRTATGRCCSAARRTRSARSGTAFATAPTPRARSSASTRRTRSASSTRCCPISPRTSRRSSRRSASSPPWDRRVTDLLNEVRSRARTGVAAPEEIVDVRAAARRAAPRQGRARARADAPRRRDLRRRAPARDGAHARRLVRIPGRGRARARVPALRRAGGRVSVDRRRRAQRLRAALSRQQPRSCRTASCC